MSGAEPSLLKGHDMSVRTIHFQRHEEANGFLYVYECGQQVPFDIRRVFSVGAKGGDIRGDHAHKNCTQLLVCVSGQIRVTCDDGRLVSKHVLEGMGLGLLIPPGVWAKQEYMVDGAVLMVLCDRIYEAEDYIRDYDAFKAFLEVKDLR